jgi:choice-of-anchor B domain-containing protein
MRSIIILMSFFLVFSQKAFSHAEHDKARYVAENGEDSGRCDNPLQPCKTISYAAQQAGKGDRVLVAKGQYDIHTEQELFYLIAQLVPVLGGFARDDQYQNQKPDIYQTIVSGIPQDYAQQLNEQGFKVIRDSKGLNQNALQQKSVNLSSLTLMQSKQSAATCTAGKSAGYSCSNMSLLAHLPLHEFAGSPASANDIWGHIDLNDNKEYALIGLRNGISVVDLTKPDSPRIVGSIAGASSTWRDIKVYQYYDASSSRWKAYAYSTTEAAEGLSIIDLTNLPNTISLVQRQATDLSAHNIYISNIDYQLNIALEDATPQVHIMGSKNHFGALRSYALSDPLTLGATYSPTFANKSDDYTHDASSLLIKDQRAQTDCTQATELGCLLMLDFNEKEMRLWDHTNVNQADQLSSSTYPNAEYTHSGWWSEDKQFVIVHDELDEQRHSLLTTINIFDISSLTNPQLAGTWTGPTRAIDHNGFVRGNRYYMSNYERGMTVLDISDPAAPLEVGYFDTYPVSDNAAFNGAWGVYPFLPSGIILVSDINSGLFILQDETLQNEHDSIALSAATITVNEGERINIEVHKTGNASARVAYELLPGSASREDFTAQAGELQWITDDTQDKQIEIFINTDLLDEYNEVFFLRLFDPRNGATLSSPNIIQIKIAGLESPPPPTPEPAPTPVPAPTPTPTPAPRSNSGGGGTLNFCLLTLLCLAYFARQKYNVHSTKA